MNRFIILLVLGLSLAAMPAFAAEQIANFDVTITVNADSSINVTEAITYDFGPEARHGVYRDIPRRYEARGGNYTLRLSNLRVVDTNSQPYQFQTSREGNDLRLRIGDPNQTVTGRHIYIIQYTVRRALNYFGDHDELYWNVTGDQWTVPIMAARATVLVPSQVGSLNFKIACFVGPAGSSDPCASSDQLLGNYLGAPNTTALFSHGELKPGQGLTIVVGFPKGIVVEPTWWQVALETVRDNWLLGLPVLVLLALILIWQRYGRDPKGQGTIIAQYDPPADLTPAEVGTIIDERVDNRDISADIIHLAVQGYLKIHHVVDKGVLDRFSKADNYILEKLKPADRFMSQAERLLLERLFKASFIETHDAAGRHIKGVQLSALKQVFYQDFKEISQLVYRDLTKRGYFAASPAAIRAIYLGGGILLLALVVFLSQALGSLGVMAIISSGALIVAFSFIMPRRTKKGVLAKEYILGLKEYLTVAEKDRIKFHNAPEKKPEVFEKLLPYAMVLKVEDQWAKQFEGIYRQQPSWYADSSGRAFNAIILTNSLSDFRAVSNAALAAKPAASGGSGLGGGGFSGGGFGGGGGGSW